MAHAIKARAGLLQNSIELLVKLLKEEHIECDWEENGVLMVFKSRSEMQKYGETNHLMKPYGLDAVSLVGDALFDLEPALANDVYGAWFNKKDSHLRPDKLLSGWQQVLLKMGVAIEENCRLEDLAVENRRIRHAQTTGGIYTADEYVLATGHGMQGISMATGTGKLVTDIITGRTPHIDPTAFGIHRFL